MKISLATPSTIVQKQNKPKNQLIFTSVMAEQRGWSRFRSWFRWINPASSSQQPKPAIPPQRPPSRPPPTSKPKVPSRTQPHPTPPSRSTSQPQPVAQTASQTPSKSQQATESQQATQTASKPSSPAPNARSKPPTQIVSQSPPPTRTSPQQPPAQTASRPPSLTSNSQLQKAAQTASQTPSPDPTAQSQPAIQTASKPPSPSRTSPQPGALAASQIPSHTAAQPQAKTLTASPLSSASRTASQLQPGTRTTTRSQTENRSTSKAAAPTSTASQPKPETKISSQTPPPPPVSQLQPATTVSKPPPPPPSPSPSQTDTEPQPAARTTSQTQSPSRPISKPKTPTQTSSPPPSPFNTVSWSQPATKTASQPPPSHTASQALSQSRATSQTQQSQQRESQRSSPSRTSPSKPKSPSSPSIPSLQPKPSSSKTAESQPALSQSLWKDTRTIAAKSSEPVLEPQTRTQRIQSQERTEEIKSLIANAENKSTEAEATTPIVAQTSAAALETSTPQSEDSIDASIGTTLSPKSEAKREAIVNKQLKTDIESNPDETPNIQGDGEPTDKRENKFLDIVSGANTSTQIQSDMITEPTEETTILRTEQMEQQALFSGNNAAPTGSKAKVNISRPSGNIKDKSTKSETQQKGSTSPGEEAALLQQEIREGVSKLVQKVDVGNPKLPGAVQSVSVVTFSGENRGASMTAGPNAVDPDSYLYIHRGYKVNKEDENEVISEREGNSNRRSDSRSGSQPMLTCINNNVQSINNALMYDSSCTDRNPGVHLVLSIKPTKPHMQKEKTESLEAKKAKLNLIASQKLKSEPTVRRRCLRGLFMESESDPENPQKPRRHGCRYRCPEKGSGQLRLEVGSDASHQND